MDNERPDVKNKRKHHRKNFKHKETYEFGRCIARNIPLGFPIDVKPNLVYCTVCSKKLVVLPNAFSTGQSSAVNRGYKETHNQGFICQCRGRGSFHRDPETKFENSLDSSGSCLPISANNLGQENSLPTYSTSSRNHVQAEAVGELNHETLKIGINWPLRYDYLYSLVEQGAGLPSTLLKIVIQFFLLICIVFKFFHIVWDVVRGKVRDQFNNIIYKDFLEYPQRTDIVTSEVEDSLQIQERNLSTFGSREGRRKGSGRLRSKKGSRVRQNRKQCSIPSDSSYEAETSSSESENVQLPLVVHQPTFNVNVLNAREVLLQNQKAESSVIVPGCNLITELSSNESPEHLGMNNSREDSNVEVQDNVSSKPDPLLKADKQESGENQLDNEDCLEKEKFLTTDEFLSEKPEKSKPSPLTLLCTLMHGKNIINKAVSQDNRISPKHKTNLLSPQTLPTTSTFGKVLSEHVGNDDSERQLITKERKGKVSEKSRDTSPLQRLLFLSPDKNMFSKVLGKNVPKHLREDTSKRGDLTGKRKENDPSLSRSNKTGRTTVSITSIGYRQDPEVVEVFPTCSTSQGYGQESERIEVFPANYVWTVRNTFRKKHLPWYLRRIKLKKKFGLFFEPIIEKY